MVYSEIVPYSASNLIADNGIVPYSPSTRLVNRLELSRSRAGAMDELLERRHSRVCKTL
jgi:hypothetical protein